MFPALVPIRPDDPASDANRRAWDAFGRWEKPFLTTFSDKETFPVDLFLLLDPLVGVSTVLAGRFVNPATLAWTVAIVAICLLLLVGDCCSAKSSSSIPSRISTALRPEA